MIKATQTASRVKEDCILEDSTETVGGDPTSKDRSPYSDHTAISTTVFFATVHALYTLSVKKDVSMVVHTNTISLRS